MARAMALQAIGLGFKSPYLHATDIYIRIIIKNNVSPLVFHGGEVRSLKVEIE